MKKTLYLLLVSIFTQCQSQNFNAMIPVVDNKFETFDEKLYKEYSNNKKPYILLTYSNKITQLQSQSFGYIERSFLFQSHFLITKKFFKNFGIMNKGVAFNEGSPIGLWYYFDEGGKLIKEENTDEGYDFTPVDVVAYCERNKIQLAKGCQDFGFRTSVLKEEMDGKKVWFISYVKSENNRDFIMEITLDGKTGKLLRTNKINYSNN